MDLATFRNTMREWVRERVAQDASLEQLPLYVTNETGDPGLDVNWLRYSLQMGEAQVIGVGTAIKRRRRLGRLYIEIFGPVGVGDGIISEQATKVEDFIRLATESAATPHKDITIFEPSTFERPEAGRYCQVVNARVQVDHFS